MSDFEQQVREGMMGMEGAEGGDMEMGNEYEEEENDLGEQEDNQAEDYY